MCLLLQVFNNPNKLASLTTEQWQLLLAQANRSNLTGRLSYLSEQHNIKAPDYVIWHLDSARTIANRQKQQALREVFELKKTLANLPCQLAYLKGSAYIVRNLPVSEGRTFSDIDVLVTKATLPNVEFRLKLNGWLKTEIDDYDDFYYRQWMHEIPPLQHVKRGTVLDVHHNILPMTNKHTPDVEKFNFETINVERIGEVVTLAPLDLCVHSAVHLFSESEFQNGLRDISDFDMLLRHFGKTNPDFLQQLEKRAMELRLISYVRKAVNFAHCLFKTPVDGFSGSLEHPSVWKAPIESFCFLKTFAPNHSSCRSWPTSLAKFILYWRGHFMRMPLTMLIPHLAKKSLKRLQDMGKDNENQAQLP